MALLAIILERRGLHKSELRRAAGRGWGNINYHLGLLEEAKLIVTETHGRLVWCFDVSTDRAERDWLVISRQSRTLRILEIIGLRQRVNVRSLSEELSMSKKVIRTHLSVLTRVNIVEKEGGRPPAFVPAQRKP